MCITRIDGFNSTPSGITYSPSSNEDPRTTRPTAGITGRSRSDSLTMASRYASSPDRARASTPGLAQHQVERPREAGRGRLVASRQQRYELIANFPRREPLTVLIFGQQQRAEDVVALP